MTKRTGQNHAAISALLAGIADARRRVFGAPNGLAFEIRLAFPNSNPGYWRLIERRFTEVYCIPEDDAIRAVRKGYSSPSAAMNARVIKRQSFVGFKGERGQ